MKRRGQLFVIEVIVSLTILIILITTLFSIQTFSPPPDQVDLKDRGQEIVELLSDSEIIFDYFADVFSFVTSPTYVEGLRLDENNDTKLAIRNTIESSLPVLVNFKGFTNWFNDTTLQWQELDIVNFKATIPQGSEIDITELYVPGFRGVYSQFTFQLLLWYEVN